MPLLGKRVFALSVHSPNKDQNAAPYLIPHTKERFESKVEYEKRKTLYEQNIWTCQATGHTCLTHEEACDSEQEVKEQVEMEFPKAMEKEVLSQVHHSVMSLDALVDKTWYPLHQKFVIGERVNLKVKVANKEIPAKIVSIDKTAYEKQNGGSSCNSPSSDKENTKDEDGKWVAPKILPYTYSIELESEAKIIHSVPANDLLRLETAPSKALMRLFIRVSAVRSGTLATSPWVVNKGLVKEHKLQSKFADLFLSPMKMADAFKSSENNVKKRKLSNGTAVPSSKKLKLDKSAEKKKKPKNKDGKDVKKDSVKKKKKADKDSSAKKASPSKKAKSDTVVVSISDSDSDADVSLADLKKQAETTPKKKTPKKAVDNSSDEDDVPLSKISGKSGSAQKKNISKLKKKNEKTPTKKDKKDKKDKDGKAKDKKDKKKDKMKQATLFDLKKGKSVQKKINEFTTPQKKTTSKSKSPPKPPPTPMIVKQLMKAKRETPTEKIKYTFLLKKAIAFLTPKQVKVLPAELKEAYDEKKKALDYKKKLASMSVEERDAFLKQKKEEAKQRNRDRLNDKNRTERKRFEDMELTLTPLPTPKLVSTPEGFPNELFGDVAMVTEFINCYGSLLMPESEYPIYTDALMKALAGGASGFTYLSRVLTVLLQTLLQDQIAEDYKEMSTKLSDVAVSSYTASELVRLCLRPEAEEDEDVPEEHVELLKDTEFYKLDLEPKLSVLKALCSRVQDTYSVQEYMEQQQKTAFKLFKQKNADLKQKQAEKKSQKQAGKEEGKTDDQQVKKEENSEDKKTEEEEDQAKKTEEDKPKVNGGSTLLNFYGKAAEEAVKEPEKKEEKKEEVPEESEGKNWRSVLKNRRIQAAKAAAEKEKLERERTELREKEYQEDKLVQKELKQQQEIDGAISLARMVLRQDAIGTDRNHDRYWVFTNTTPGLYVEKGWMGDEINYSFKKEKKKAKKPRMDGDDSSDDDFTMANVSRNQTGDTPLKIKYHKRNLIESTTPMPGPNLWFTYRSQKDLDTLLATLHPQGIRESLLKSEITKRYDDMNKAIIQSQRMAKELRDCDGDNEMLEGFKRELSDMELKLRNGGLGGVDHFEEWEARLNSATDVSVMAELLLESKDNILDKFMQGFMKPEVKEEEEEVKEEEERVKEEDMEVEEKSEDKTEEDAKDSTEKRGRLTKNAKALRVWREAVSSCSSMSRLHVLMAVLDTCIKWEKSAENAKCKICRKKTDDDRLLLCDDCNQAFHMYCLRPSLTKLPSGDWFCPACKPNRRDEMKQEADDSEEEEEPKETACRECNGKDKLLVCSSCPAAFHISCHDPPLRHFPRGVWECCDCKNGVTRRSKGRRKGQLSRGAKPKKAYNYDKKVQYEEDTSSEEGSNSDTDSDKDFEGPKPAPVPRSKGKAGKVAKAAPKKTTKQVVKYLEESDESSEEETKKPASTSRSRGKGSATKAAPKKSKKKTIEYDEESEESEEEVTKPTSTSRSRGKGSATKAAPKKSNKKTIEYDEESEQSEEETPKPASTSRSRGRTSLPKVTKTPPSAGGRGTRGGASPKDSPSTLTPTFRGNRRGPSEISLCEEVLQKIMKHELAWPFLEPVDRKSVPDYYQLIKKPMDFLTMQRKLARLSYATPQEFIEDAALVFENTESYNKKDTEVYECMEIVEKSMKEMLKKALPDWPYYRTVQAGGKEADKSGSDSGRRRASRGK